jgi:cob(I)alamin adenosyltransferase
VGAARVAKDSLRIRAYGALDEVAAHLALAEALLPPDATALGGLLQRLQHETFVAMTELATPTGRPPAHAVTERHVARLEADIDRVDALAPPLTSFVLPRGTPAAAELHVLRTVARRAEREIVALHRAEAVPAPLLAWVNRLSDLAFALARAVNRAAGLDETAPDYDA